MGCGASASTSVQPAGQQTGQDKSGSSSSSTAQPVATSAPPVATSTSQPVAVSVLPVAASTSPVVGSTAVPAAVASPAVVTPAPAAATPVDATAGVADAALGAVEQLTVTEADSAVPGVVKPAAKPTRPVGLPPWKNDPVTLQVIPSEDMGVEGGQDEVTVLVRLQSPKTAERVPACFCCVLDISGSMGAEATIVGTGGSLESHGLSLLDVAKHGVRTIINTLNEQDQLSIVSFNHEAASVLGLTVMDEVGKKLAEERLLSLRAGGRTNLWAGLCLGLDSLRGNTVGGSLSHVMLLSDGASMLRDTIMPNLVNYKDDLGHEMPGTINTFGFGYNIDSELLVNIAAYGNGSYGFIPDAGFIGTIFVNCMSNLLVTFAQQVMLSLEAQQGAEILSVLGGLEVQEQSLYTKTAHIVKVGMLQYQQNRDVVVRMRTHVAGSYLLVSGYLTPLDRDGASIVKLANVEGPSTGNKQEVNGHVIRAKIVDNVHAALYSGALNRTASMASSSSAVSNGLATSKSAPNATGGGFFSGLRTRLSYKRGSTASTASTLSTSLGPAATTSAPTPSTPVATQKEQIQWHRETAANHAKSIVEKLLEEMQSIKDVHGSDAYLDTLFEDVTGQMSEAVSCVDYFVKWGRHYLPSLMFAHQNQQCNNFKDPGVQAYGGTLFEDLRDAADEIFCQLPPPQVTALSAVAYGGLPGGVSTAPPVSMSAYMDRYAA